VSNLSNPMTTSNALQSRPSDTPAAGTPAPATCRLRDRLAALHPSLDMDQPHVLDRAAQAYSGAHVALHGEMSLLGGHRAPDKWRKAITAVDRDLTLVDLAYLAEHPSPGPRDAVRAVVAVLAEALDGRRPNGSVRGHAADAVLAAATLNRAAERAFEDGHVTSEERSELLQAVVEARRSLDAVVSLLNGGAR
jgi:hypothetical protein